MWLLPHKVMSCHGVAVFPSVSSSHATDPRARAAVMPYSNRVIPSLPASILSGDPSTRVSEHLKFLPSRLGVSRRHGHRLNTRCEHSKTPHCTTGCGCSNSSALSPMSNSSGQRRCSNVSDWRHCSQRSNSGNCGGCHLALLDGLNFLSQIRSLTWAAVSSQACCSSSVKPIFLPSFTATSAAAATNCVPSLPLASRHPTQIPRLRLRSVVSRQIRLHALLLLGQAGI